VRLILVRHGLSRWNLEGRLQGVRDPELSDAGRDQARAVGPLVAALRPEVAVSSDLRRAVETLRLLGLPLEPLEPDPRWRESDLGDWAGRLPSELSDDERAAFAAWRAGRATPPDGEDWRAARARVLAAVRDLERSGVRRALVVTHGGPVRSACAELAGLELERMVPVGNASLTVIETGPPGTLLALGVTLPRI
jgi:glucosyl-3-phosphoglycerate phosphatase